MLENIQNILKRRDKKVWVMFNEEACDKYFCKYVSNNISTCSICIIAQEKIFVIANILDSKNLKEYKFDTQKVKKLVYSNNEELNKIIEEIIAELNFPNEILLSYSTMGDKNIDILTHGNFLRITKILKKPYLKYTKKIRFTSSEKLIYEIESRKTDKELIRLKYIANITIEILEDTFKMLKTGLSEIQIVDLTKTVADIVMKKYIGKEEIINFDFAWENCPLVLTGANLAKSGHSLPSDKIFLKGDTIYFDFGIKAIFSDGQELYSDIQRMGYAINKNETKVPKSIEKVFDTLVSAIEDGMEEMKTRTFAYKVDKVVREKILNAGYPDYLHATGHPVGLKVHDAGAIISLKQVKRSNLRLVENGVYTLEPRINKENGGSIEEMIQVTKFGGIPLCKVQNKLYIITN